MMYKTKSQLVSSLVFVGLLSIAYMYFTPQGSFDPTQFGFYWSILSALFIVLLIDWLVPKLLLKTSPVVAPALGKQITLLPEVGEVLLEEGASHFKGREAVGGKLFLTEEKLIFKSHRFNIQNHTETFLLEKIQNVTLVKDRLLTFDYEGKPHKFTIIKAEQWVERLSKFAF